MFKNSNTKKSNIRSHLAAMKMFIEKLLLKFNSPLERKIIFFTMITRIGYIVLPVIKTNKKTW